MLKLSCVFLLVNVYINCRISRVSAAAANATLDVRSVSFWRSLSSKLHIFDKTFCEAQGTFATDVVDASMVRNLVWNEGYAQLEPLEWGLPLGDMVEIIEELHQRNIPITFCFMYDEFWFMFMRLHHTLGHVLGPEYKRLPDFWAWRVDPKHSERGWKVHRDKNYETLYRNGLPKSLSVWIPLTDATTSNGCMYVLPADRDPTYRKMQAIGQHWEDIAPDIRALPVQAGGALIWNQMVWHWGSRSNSRGTQPRYSLAVEFQADPSADDVYPAVPNPFPNPDTSTSETSTTAPGSVPNSALNHDVTTIPTSATTTPSSSIGTATAGAVGSTSSSITDSSHDSTSSPYDALRSSSSSSSRTVGGSSRGTEDIDPISGLSRSSREYLDMYGDTVPHYNDPLSNPLRLPFFPERLQLVAKQILQYKHMYPLSAEWQDLAESILSDPPV